MACLDQEVLGWCWRQSRSGWVGCACCSGAHRAASPDNLTLRTAFITAFTVSRDRGRPQWLAHRERLSGAVVLSSRASIIHGIDFCCVEYYIVFTFAGIIQQGKQIVFFGSKVNINSVRDSICCLSLMESNLSLACV